MKKILIIITCFLSVIPAVTAADKNAAAIEFIKTLIGKANAENGYVQALRYFQFTATAAKSNPSSYVLSKWGKEVFGESGLKEEDRGRFMPVLSDRSGARIEKLWKENKEDLYALFPAASYDAVLKDEVNSLIEFRSAPEFDGMMKKMKAKLKKPGVKTMDVAGAVTGWSGYKQLAFWYRRNYEKNDKAVFEILKELKVHYAQ